MSNFSQFRVVLAQGPKDNAIDQEAMLAPRVDEAGKPKLSIAEEYFNGIYDERLLTPFLRKDSQPLWYVLKPIRARQMNDLVENFYAPTPAELWDVAQRCLASLEGPHAFALELRHFKVIDQAKGTKMLTDDAMDELAEAIGLLAVRELGAAVIRRTRVAPDKTAAF